nr:YdcF family protein [Rhizomicrobium palustre]
MGIVAYAGGFILFAANLPQTPKHVPDVDGIVALTGGGLRLDAAVTLFERGAGERLLISGVNTQTTKTDLKRIVHGRRRFDCCADLGYAAENTFGNAKEAAAWTRFHRYRRIILVTSRYHMPRSLLEFHDVMPDVKVVPYPVDTDGRRGFPRNLKALHSEYWKFLAVRIMTSAGLEPDLDRTKPLADSHAAL